MITINEEEVQKEIEKEVQYRLENITYNYIHNKVQDDLFRRVDGTYDWNKLKFRIDEILTEKIEERLAEEFTDEKIKKIAEDIGRSLAWRFVDHFRNVVYNSFQNTLDDEDDLK